MIKIDIKTKFNNWRWKTTKQGYKFDKLIFNIAFWLLIGYLFSIAYSMNFDFSVQIYFKCDNNISCENPYYDRANIRTDNLFINVDNICIEDWCYQEMLPSGFEYGSKNPPILLRLAWPVTWLLIILSLLINHFMYNNKGGINIE